MHTFCANFRANSKAGLISVLGTAVLLSISACGGSDDTAAGISSVQGYPYPYVKKYPLRESNAIYPTALGDSVDSFTGQRVGAGSAFKSVQTRQKGAGTEIKTSLWESTETLQTALLGEASVDYKSKGFFPSTHIQAKVDYANELASDSNAIGLIVQVKKSSARIIDSAVLQSAKVTNVIGFYNSFGDSYVAQIEEGGEYVAVYRFVASNQEEKSRISGALNAAVGGTDVDVQSALSKASSVSNKSFTFQSNLYGFKSTEIDINPPVGNGSPSEVFKYASAVAKAPDPSAPVVLSVGYASYADLNDFSQNQQFRTLKSNIENLTASSIPSIPSLPVLQSRVSELDTRLTKLRSIYEFYGAQDLLENDSNYINSKNNLRLDYTALSTYISKFKTNPIANISTLGNLPDPVSLKNGKPDFRYQTAEAGYCGGGGGGHFSDLDALGDAWSFINNQVKLVSITSTSDKAPNAGNDVVSSLMATYQGPSSTLKHGGGTGNSRTSQAPVMPDKQPNDIFSGRIAGRCGAYVDMLKFPTFNQGNPNGGGTVDFKVSFAEGAAAPIHFLAFTGSAGSVVDNIGATYFRLQPLQWKSW